MKIQVRDFQSERYSTTHKDRVKALGLCIFSIIAFLFYGYTAVLCKVLDPALGLPMQAFFREDYYFCFLIPLTLLPSYAFFYLNFISKTIFDHN